MYTEEKKNKKKEEALLRAINANIKHAVQREIHGYTGFPLNLNKDGGSKIPFIYKTDSNFFSLPSHFLTASLCKEACEPLKPPPKTNMNLYNSYNLLLSGHPARI